MQNPGLAYAGTQNKQASMHSQCMCQIILATFKDVCSEVYSQ